MVAPRRAAGPQDRCVAVVGSPPVGSRARDPLRQVDLRRARPRAASSSTRSATSAMQPSSVDLRVDRLLPRLPQRHDALHRPEAGAGGPDRAGRGRGEPTAPSSSTPASSCSARRSSASRSATTSSPGSRASRRLGRLGLLIHSTAGFVDAGWDGHLTLELSNVANLPIAIYPGMKIGQISFLRMTTAGRGPLRQRASGLEVQGPAGPDALPLLPELPRLIPQLRVRPCDSRPARRALVFGATAADREGDGWPTPHPSRNRRRLPSGSASASRASRRPRGPGAGRTQGRRGLHVCPRCASQLVQPDQWAPVDSRRWRVELSCPDCELARGRGLPPAALDRYDEIARRGRRELVRELQELAAGEHARGRRALRAARSTPT